MEPRAGIFSPSFAAGGLEVRLQEEAAVLAELGAHCSWFAPAFPGKEQLRDGFRRHGCEVVDLELADPFRHWHWRRLQMARLRLQARSLRRYRLQCAHVALSWTNSGLTQALACSEAAIPYVAAVHNYFPVARLSPWTHSAATRAFRGARAIYAVSRSALDAFVEIYDGCLPADVALCVIENGIDLDRFRGTVARAAGPRAETGASPDTLFLVFAGRLDEKKRPHLAVELLAELHRSGVDALLVLLGTGPLEPRVLSLAGQLGVSDRVHVLGHCADPERFYGAADAIILPSRSEGLPLALLEAAACGALPIGYPVPGITDVIEDGHNGLLLDLHSAERSARHIADHWRRRDGWTAMVATAMRTARERHSRPLMRQRLLELYRRTFPELPGRSTVARAGMLPQ